MKTITVGMADLRTGRDGDKLITLGLGSCVGVTLFDPITHIGGLAHVMLPQSVPSMAGNRAKFADTALEDLYKEIIRMGATASKLQAKMAGGAHMFSQAMKSDVIKVGERNAFACRQLLARMRIPLRVEDTGGTYGRTIELDTQTGALTIKTIGHGIRTV